MTLLEADRVQRLEQFGEDTHDLLRLIQASFGMEFTTDDLVQIKTIRELGSCSVTVAAKRFFIVGGLIELSRIR